MNADGMRFSFGPVPSRRLGRSVGINHIPAKTCSYACVYCQVGRTTTMLAERRPFFSAEEIAADLRDRIDQARRDNATIDYLTFVPDGEPTLDLNLGREIRLLRPLGIPIGVITNSSLIWREDVRSELAEADWVSLKIDAVREPAWRRINRPHRALSLDAILDGALAFAGAFRGKLVSETMLLQGGDQDEGHVREIAEFLGRLRPAVAYLSVPTRPPAEKATCRPDESSLNRAFQIIAARVQAAELLIGYEGDAFASTGDIEKDLLAITAVHPMRREAIEKMLAKAGVSWSLVEALQSRGDLAASEYEGNEYYLRSFHKSAKAGTEQLSKASPPGRKEKNNAMEKDNANRILEGEIVDDAREGSPPLPVTKAPAPKAVGTGGWIEVIAAIGGGIIRWLDSSSRNTPSGGGNQTGRGGGGGKMRRRRGGGR